MAKPDELNTAIKPTWCPGCGNFGIWNAFKKALTELGRPTENVCVVYGVGCHGHEVNFLNITGFEGLHGRAVPVALGAKLANKSLDVFVVAGDGDCFGEGLGHFLHAARGNHDIKIIVHNNMTYGLTTGQASATSSKGSKSKSTPFGSADEPINPVKLALTSGATFVARGYAKETAHLAELIKSASAHKGFAVIDVLQPCVTWNHVNTYEWFNGRVYDIQKEGHDISDFDSAMKKAEEFGEKIPIGIFYKSDKPAYHERLPDVSKGASKPRYQVVCELLERFR